MALIAPSALVLIEELPECRFIVDLRSTSSLSQPASAMLS